MKTVLVVEDSSFFGVMIKDKIKAETSFDALWVQDMSEAVKVLNETGNSLFAAILDFNLPDAPQGEIIDEVVDRDLPAIVYTSDLSEKVRDMVWSKNVADYALKDDSRSLDYIISMLKRFERNIGTKIMVVEDSHFFRKILTDLLRVHCYKVFSAHNGMEALDLLEEHPDMKLVVTDFSMPGMDGLALTQKIREKYDRNDLAIIGVSSEGDKLLAARFIKNGANDFIIKQSFLTEEFYCRVTQSIENLEHIQMVREAAIKDFLTGLNNRRYFFDEGSKFFMSAARDKQAIACGMIDIDYFKKVNDTYGHEAGDVAICHISSILRSSARETDIVARLGGEEFCILAVNMSAEDAGKIFEDIRGKVEKSPVDIDGQKIKITVSIGVATKPGNSLDGMVGEADRLLYDAKESGRNKVVMK
ncbi:diguanylate cyclase [Desulfococcaceae bacterium HSG8]|nr:diguanylate cyclase [Desulfococcaceae bacterium HSG8]